MKRLNTWRRTWKRIAVASLVVGGMAVGPAALAQTPGQESEDGTDTSGSSTDGDELVTSNNGEVEDSSVGLSRTLLRSSGSSFTRQDLLDSWDPGFILSDTALYTSSLISAQGVKEHIQNEGASCTTGNGKTCLKDMTTQKVTLTSKFAGMGYGCKTLTLAAGTKSWDAIKKVGDACGINPQVLLVFIQKESSGVYQALTTAQWDKMMGMGCPDNQACKEEYKGFINQLYYSADALTSYRYRGFKYNLAAAAGTTTSVPYSSGDSSCGSQSFVIQNQATASLYTYNPAVPNKAALESYPGYATAAESKCASYGQRNVYTYMWKWFPETMQDHPSVAPISFAGTRLSGKDRYATNAAVNRSTMKAGAPVFVATGLNYADALSIGPAVAKVGGSLFLTSASGLSAESRELIKTKNPSAVYIVGGTGAVSQKVVEQVESDTKLKAVRIAGDDRYATSVAVAKRFFSGSVPLVFLATGLDFPDALSASAAGGALQAPVLLVDGRSSVVPPETKQYLASSSPTSLVAVGGTAAVSDKTLSAVGAAVPSANRQRLSGETRVGTNGAVNSFVTEKTGVAPGELWVASGRDFPDALSAAVPAGKTSGRLVLTSGACLPSFAARWITASDSKVRRVVAVGGTAVLGNGVLQGTVCSQ